MKRQHHPPYMETNMSPYNQHRGGSRGGGSTYNPGRSDSLYSEAMEDDLPPPHHQYKSAAAPPKSEGGKWSQWDREPQNLPPPNQVPSHAAAAFNEGQGGNLARSYYQSQTDPKVGLESQGNKEARPPPLEQDMEIGYEDDTIPLTFEGLQRKFYDDVMKLAKEQTDAEDAENARHQERKTEINTRYQEKLSALREQQGNRREECLRKEGQAQLRQYQQAGIGQYSNASLQQDARGYSGTPVSGATGEARRAYGSNHYHSYRDRPNYSSSGRSQSADGRVPYPEGRVYNNAGARYFQ